MKCPKCGYLGFETTDRCRNCGYDFSLSTHIDTPSELPLRSRTDAEAPLSDFDLGSLDTSRPAPDASGLDLDRLIGDTEPTDRPPRIETATAVATPPADDVQERFAPPQARPPAKQPAPEPVEPLPLFNDRRGARDESPPLVAPRPARPPLAVRRATPDVARRRTPRTVRREDSELALQPDTSTAGIPSGEHDAAAAAVASRLARISSALIDLLLIGGIDAAVLYLTLAIAGLSFDAVRSIPAIPMAAFLLMLNAGYLIAFTAAGGQTIGKMIAGIRVVGDDGGRVDLAAAVLRSAGVILSLAALGLPYLPALFTEDARAVHDRLAGTRVVKNA
jgi:uncharacterized RDD family membrane protein YckC